MVSDLVASARGVSYDFKMVITMMVPKNSTFTLMVPPEIGVGKNGTNVTCQLN